MVSKSHGDDAFVHASGFKVMHRNSHLTPAMQGLMHYAPYIQHISTQAALDLAAPPATSYISFESPCPYFYMVTAPEGSPHTHEPYLATSTFSLSACMPVICSVNAFRRPEYMSINIKSYPNVHATGTD